MKKYLFLCISITIVIFACENNPTKNNLVEVDLIENIIMDTDLDSLSYFVEALSGERSVSMNGNNYIISSRHRDYSGNNIAADFIEKKLEEYGMQVSIQTFGASGENVIGRQSGTEFPDQHYIICAHYDCMPDSSLSPGADDNASGTAAVLEAARILRNYSSKYSIIYALWDEEEQGLIGALNYAHRARNNNENIVGLINMDMLGWDSNYDGRFWINVRDTANSVQMSDRMVQIHDEYDIGLSPQILNPGSGSDNLVFWYYGFAALGIEEMYGEDWNDHYHLTSDTFDKFNLDYFYKISKLVIGSTASLAEVSVK